jgi:putative hydrolase of the HAD superfamily
MRKPNSEIYNYVLNEHDLQAKRTLFIDDKKENTDAALLLGFTSMEFTGRQRRRGGLIQ